jgi:hypothetical protein
MKAYVWTGIVMAAAASSALAFDDLDDVKAAAKKLEDSANYSWTTTTKNNAETPGQGAGRYAPGPVEGKSEKGGVTWYSMKQGENVIEGAMKGDKFAFKVKDQWMGSGDVPGGAPQGRPDPSMFLGRILKTMKPGAQGFSEMIGRIKDLKSEGGGLYSGEFSPEGARDQITPPRPEGVPGNVTLPAISDAKGTIKVWVKDGMVSKVESTMLGKMTIGGKDREINRTTTVEFKDVGTTKVEIPDEAKKKLE